MDKITYTPEPWVYADINGTHQVVPAAAHPEAEPAALVPLYDYERSVAAVNACSGMADPEKEIAALCRRASEDADLIRDQVGKLDAAEKEIAELRAEVGRLSMAEQRALQATVEEIENRDEARGVADEALASLSQMREALEPFAAFTVWDEGEQAYLFTGSSSAKPPAEDFVRARAALGATSEDEEPNEADLIECGPCSRASGSGAGVRHLPPACSEGATSEETV